MIDKLTATSTIKKEAVLSSSQRLVEEENEGPSTRLLPQVCPIPQRLAIGRGVGGAPVTQELVEVRKTDIYLISPTVILFTHSDWNRTTSIETSGYCHIVCRQVENIAFKNTMNVHILRKTS